jgi:hypothetical protein
MDLTVNIPSLVRVSDGMTQFLRFERSYGLERFLPGRWRDGKYARIKRPEEKRESFRADPI